MESSFWCPVADSTFARKTVLSVAVDIDLPVRPGQQCRRLQSDCGTEQASGTHQERHQADEDAVRRA
jgi:hypothetical protein